MIDLNLLASPLHQEEVDVWLKHNTLPDLRAGFVIDVKTKRLVFVALPEGHVYAWDGIPLTPEQRAFLQGGMTINPKKEPPK